MYICIYVFIYILYLREYVYYVGRLNGSIYLVNTRLDLRNAANCVQIEGPGALHGDPYTIGGGGNAERETIHPNPTLPIPNSCFNFCFLIKH